MGDPKQLLLYYARLTRQVDVFVLTIGLRRGPFASFEVAAESLYMVTVVYYRSHDS